MHVKQKIIKTEVENEQALDIVEQLMHLHSRTPDQEAIYELLVVLIERFEQDFYKPNSESNPGSMLAFLMDQRDLQPINLVTISSSGNPFSDRVRIEDPTRFFGRTEFLRRLQEDLQKGMSLALVGETQIGKSSIDFIHLRLQPTGVKFSDRDIAEIYQQTNGHPGQLQQAAADLFDLVASALPSRSTNPQAT